MKKEMKNVPELRFSGFTEDWIQTDLKKVCDKIQDGNYGGDYPKANEFLENGVPFLTSKAINPDGSLTEGKVDYISPEKHSQLKKAHLQLNDVLFTNRGANVGVIGFVDSRVSNGNIGPQLTLLRSDHKSITPLFLKNIMVSFSVVKQIRSQDSGSAMNFFGIGATSKFKLIIPTLPEQQKIASFLSAVDKKIEQLTCKKELLEQYKKGVIQKIFSQEIRFKDDNGQNYPDWEEKKLGEFVDFIRNGISFDQNNERQGVKVTRIETISSNKIDINRVGYVKTSKDLSAYKLLIGDLLFSNINSVAHIGKVVRVDLDYNLYHGMNLLNIRLNQDVADSTYCFYVLSSNKYKNHFETICNRAVNQASINQTSLKKINVRLPVVEEQQKIADFLSSIDTKISTVQTQLSETQNFKKGLLQKMFV
ncbi:restriction endonuclease subunit S [Desulfogranum marinum]|uniref:restriction endonuclease subunit S n=1 Tax=Desulfogranum marinum TaxID=453220 RepID=UPI0019668318|nr:restriction endonuclease subunit S [Desulfogranum marinum]MBM9514996.1 restriction endonuclease subunit S [Desulfogranum marinum]